MNAQEIRNRTIAANYAAAEGELTTCPRGVPDLILLVGEFAAQLADQNEIAREQLKLTKEIGTEFRGESPEKRQLVGALKTVFLELRELRKEVRQMAQTEQDQIQQLASDVTGLTQAFTDFETAIAAEIASIKSSPAAADPVIAQALTNIESLTAKIKGDTAAAVAASTPAPSTGDTGAGTTGDGIETIA